MFLATLAFGSFACSQGAPIDAEIVSQLETSEKVEPTAPTAAGPSDPAPGPSDPAPRNSSGDGEAFLAPASTAGDPVVLIQPPIVAELPPAAASLPPPPPPPAQDNIVTLNSQNTVGFQILNPYAIDSTTFATLPNTRPKFDTASINPNFVDALPIDRGQYCDNKFNECTQQATGPAGVSACSGAFNWCMDSGNCAVRTEICQLNNKINCVSDAEICFLEDKCRKKKIACVTDTQETVQCEGDRQLCYARIEGHLASCHSIRGQCFRDASEGGSSTEKCYRDYDYCKTNMEL
jgi:hypothetical protein